MSIARPRSRKKGVRPCQASILNTNHSALGPFGCQRSLCRYSRNGLRTNASLLLGQKGSRGETGKRQSPVNIQGVHRAMDSFIQNSISPLVPLTDTVLFPLDKSDLSRSCTKQMAPSARPKRSRGSNPVLHSINKTQKQVLFPSIADQIPENIYTR